MPARSNIFVLSPAQARTMDRLCTERYGIPVAVLMENAGVQVAAAARSWEEQGRPARILVVAGTGNNGGDGLVAARHLVNSGHRVAIMLVGDPARMSVDTAAQWRTCRAMKIPSIPTGVTGGAGVKRALKLLGCGRRGPDVIVAGLFGTGLSREVSGKALEVIQTINEWQARGSRVVAVDIPSGLNASTGEVMGGVVQADITVTFVALKSGMLAPGALKFLGEVQVADIGVPRALIEKLATALPAKRWVRG
ncbi:MAG: NAD(P)H-hydrate epimerase [Phycisphaerales bacterium]